MRSCALALTLLAFPFLGSSGDWGKASVDKAPIVEECLDLGASISFGYSSDYLYKGYLFGGDTVSTQVNYSFEGLSTLIHLGIGYANVVSENTFANVANDDLALSARADLPSLAGIDAAVSYTYHSYPEGTDSLQQKAALETYLHSDLQLLLPMGAPGAIILRRRADGIWADLHVSRALCR